MTKCPICKVGNMVTSGMHSFCDKCNATVFQINDDYIDECAKLIGLLISNTKFISDDALTEGVIAMINTHTPMLAAWLNGIMYGQQSIVARITSLAMDHAINVEIGENPLQNVIQFKGGAN